MTVSLEEDMTEQEAQQLIQRFSGQGNDKPTNSHIRISIKTNQKETT